MRSPNGNGQSQPLSGQRSSDIDMATRVSSHTELNLGGCSKAAVLSRRLFEGCGGLKKHLNRSTNTREIEIKKNVNILCRAQLTLQTNAHALARLTTKPRCASSDGSNSRGRGARFGKVQNLVPCEVVQSETE